MTYELKKGCINNWQFRKYVLLFHLFIFSMIAVSVVNNIGLMWVGIELTTIISALLVGLYQKKSTLEAAWKYLIMGSVGLSFALLGIIFLYLSKAHLPVESPDINWTTLMALSQHLDPRWAMTAFVFILVGYGTKAGLAPMHFWLPDAHSQAPSPMSAVLSGVLLNTSLYGILRIYAITNNILDSEAALYMIFFGIFSIAIPVAFILVQHDLKRLLAYSSVEHIGIIALGIGIGGPLGLYGAILHMFNHSMAKTLLFMTAGNITQKYHTKYIGRIFGVIKAMPITGIIFLISAFAILGMPPFNVFVSEFTIMMAGFKEGYIGVTVLFIIFITLIFIGMAQYVMKMSFGVPPANIPQGEISFYSVAALFLPLIFVVTGGLYVSPFLNEVIHKVAAVLQKGG
jgi:hydrogenase-4 component F